ncbi:hypothetical protein GGX14DRAFT_387336 [Mycena pura]|uniref:Uncharacterized protein n=1 Tax=Mycena pura TaxID=153505 RepID=A0AAD7E330_9AGAR|nr:hypothetical protein GGX14DRAFT_387336 [Mycena pura]
MSFYTSDSHEFSFDVQHPDIDTDTDLDLNACNDSECLVKPGGRSGAVDTLAAEPEALRQHIMVLLLPSVCAPFRVHRARWPLAYTDADAAVAASSVARAPGAITVPTFHGAVYAHGASRASAGAGAGAGPRAPGRLLCAPPAWLLARMGVPPHLARDSVDPGVNVYAYPDESAEDGRSKPGHTPAYLRRPGQTRAGRGRHCQGKIRAGSAVFAQRAKAFKVEGLRKAFENLGRELPFDEGLRPSRVIGVSMPTQKPLREYFHRGGSKATHTSTPIANPVSSDYRFPDDGHSSWPTKLGMSSEAIEIDSDDEFCQ